MRMGNICMLDWADINMPKRVIRCENLKTGGKLTIPILPGLYEYLLSYGPKNKGYVSEDHAARYSRNLSAVSADFTSFLQSIGIETQVKLKGRTRASNIKGVHAMRHTFIYRAMLAGVPVNVIQCIVGHVDEDITKMYADHVMAEDAQKAMRGFSISEKHDPRQDLINSIMKKLSDTSIDRLKKISKIIEVI